MMHLVRLVIIALIASPTTAAEPNEQQVLRMGLLPYLSPELLLETHNPLIRHLEQRLGQKVTVSTAPDFQTYVERTSSGYFDIYLTAPHMAALAIHRDGHIPLGRYARQMQGVIVVAEDSPMRSLSDLRGKSVAAADRMAVITLLGETAIADQGGLSPDDDLQMVYLPSHNSALLSVSGGRADAAIVGSLVYEKMAPTLRTRLRVLAYTTRIPHMMYVARPSLAPRADIIRSHLLSFSAPAASEQEDAAGLGPAFGVLTEISSNDLQVLAPLVSRLMDRKAE